MRYLVTVYVAMVAAQLFSYAFELVRDDPARNAIGPLSTSQWIAAIVVAACALWTYLRSARTRGQGSLHLRHIRHTRIHRRGEIA